MYVLNAKWMIPKEMRSNTLVQNILKKNKFQARWLDSVSVKWVYARRNVFEELRDLVIVDILVG